MPGISRAVGATVPADQDDYDAQLSASVDWPLQADDWRQHLLRLAISSKLRRGVLGILVFIALWYLLTTVIVPPRFGFIPDPLTLLRQWLSPEPDYGISLFTLEYYEHIGISLLRVYGAFVLSVSLGAPLGILMGWSPLVRNLLSPLVELLRPIPPLAWVPLAVLLLPGTESAVLFVTLLAAFFAMVLNSYLGVCSIPTTYLRAAACLGYRRRDVLLRIIVPGALPSIFTGLQIAMGVAWFSLVGGEMIAGRSGLGYLILDAYTQLVLPNIFIGMITLGLLGWLSSALIRRLGERLMRWHGREGGRS